MTDKEYAFFKRASEWYMADPSFRKSMEEDAGNAVRDIGLDTKDALLWREAVHCICAGNAVGAEGNLYLEEYSRRYAVASAYVNESFSRDSFADVSLYKYSDTVKNRCRMESRLIRLHENIRYFMSAIELSDGCSCRCPFCGLDAKEWKSNFEYSPENARLFRGAAGILRSLIGDIAGEGPCFFATEPFDNPDYEHFIKDMEEITGRIPQTTTALADADPSRTRRFMEQIGAERLSKQAKLRFSVRSLVQFKRIAKTFSPMELINVELLMNNRESNGRYSASGRAGAIKDKPLISYTICCLAGLLVNMARRTIIYIEPEMPCSEFPLGYRVLEKESFHDTDEFAEKAGIMLSKYAKGELPFDEELCLNPYASIGYTENEIMLKGPGAGFRIKRNIFTEKAIGLFRSGASLGDALEEAGLPEDWKAPFTDAMNRLYAGGYLRIKRG